MGHIRNDSILCVYVERLTWVQLLYQIYFQGSGECEVFIHHTAMKKFTNHFEMKINSGMSY